MLQAPASARGGAQYALAHVAQSDPYHMYPWVSGFGGYYYNDTTGLVGLNSTGTIAAANWFKTNILPYLAPDLGGDSQRALFYEKKAAMLISGPWSVAAVNTANISYGLALIPKIVPGNTQPMPYSGVKGLWVTKNVKTENLEAVIAFLKWWTSAQNQIAFGKILGWVPVAPAAYNDPAISSDPVIKGFGDQIKYTIPIPTSPQMGEVWGPAGDAWNAVFSGAQTPEQAFQAAQDTIINNIKVKYGTYP
jgi:arabinogalactan oligomer/maltooligosaccharide transport system substrate-binding protein